MDPRRTLPPDLVERARAYAAGRLPAVDARPAATVVLLRPAGGDDADPPGVEAYLLRRHAGMPFAAGMYAFPGGAVDPRDAAAHAGWAGPPPAAWAQRLRTDEATARSLLCAAVRETFEESGVLLAGPGPDEVVADLTDPSWEADRLALLRGALSLSELLERRGLVLRSDLLGYWAHWVTPRFESRRYDTRFFVAALPAGQRTRDVSGEADRVCWLPPAAAVAAALTGDMPMLPPTYAVLSELADVSRPAAALAATSERVVERIVPGWVDDGVTVTMTLPGDPAHPGVDPGDPAGPSR